ncbi:MAG TPA: TIM barrel protein [Thermogutta sp.]|nr:TIM barrel protein [Thermogutta sp.]
MFVAATTRCFANLPLEAAFERLNDLEFGYVEIMLHESDGHLKPSEVAADLDRAIALCRKTYRLTPIAYSVDIEAQGDEYYRQFAACCKLAKATRVVTVVVRASELGTPFNEEVERLQNLVAIATMEEVVVALLTERGRMSELPETAAVLCHHAKGLGICLDPSHLIYGRETPLNPEPALKYVRHVRLRDTRKDKFQVLVGQGKVEYGKLLANLGRYEYNRALAIDIAPEPGVDQSSELRKLRLLLETLL